MHSASSGTDPTAKKNPEKPHLGYSQFLCNIMWAPHLSYHSCNYSTFVGWCLHDLSVTCIHKYHRCHTSCLSTMLLQLSKHTDCMMFSRVIYCLFDTVLSAHILQPLRVRSTGNACHMCIGYHLITTEYYCAPSLTHVKIHFTATNNTVETCISNTKHLRTCCIAYSFPCF
jgi:hypothetical protein